MTPYTATDLIRSMTHASGVSIPDPYSTNPSQGSSRFIAWVRTILLLG